MSAQSLPIAIPETLTIVEPFRLGYRPSLDGVRGIAILAVLAVHTNHLFGWSLLKGGSIGVDIFFVLSGFLITSLLIEEWTTTGRINLWNFYARRFLRLVPALVVVVSVLLIVSGALFTAQEAAQTRRAMPIALLYLTDFFASLSPATALGALRHTWSLAMEEHFYLLWPPALLLLLKTGWSKRVLLAITVSVALAVCFHRGQLFQPGMSPARTYYGFDTRADSLLIGCVAAMFACWGFFRGFKSSKRISGLSIGLILLALITTDFASPVMHEGGFTILAGTTALLLVNLMCSDGGVLRSFLELRPLVWVGKVSYGLYLWHYPVFKWMAHFSLPWPAKLALAVLVTFAVTSISFYALERPVLSLKRRFV